MKLTLPQLHFNEKLEEFDFWITPALGEIRSSERYKDVQDSLCSLIEIIGSKINYFASIDDINSEKIADAIVTHTNGLPNKEKLRTIEALAAFLFLVTGKTDNNSKCQFPIFLRDIARISGYPKVTGSKSAKVLSEVDIPREIKSDKIAKLFCELSVFPKKQYEFLTQYIDFILNGDQYINSLWTTGNTYFAMKKLGYEKDFLQPMIIFQVRGSVSASGGHEPEDLLRQRMQEWGLKPNVDFNNSDIIIIDLPVNDEKENSDNASVADLFTQGVEDSAEVTVDVSAEDTAETVIEKVEETIKNKTRAYDFVLPYNVDGWDQKIFIQCQFYAGDSGSVSHKNVDQTRTSREYVKTKRANPIFLEYIDGAGYFSSLWGDLKKILAMTDTDDFFQVRTAVIKLRGKLQSLGYLTPLEVIHAWALNEGLLDKIRQHLIKEGYVEKEIERVLQYEIFKINNNNLNVDRTMIELSRRYLLLDFIAVKGKRFTDYSIMRGVLLVPAFGKYYGMRIEELVDGIIPIAGFFKDEWKDTTVIFKDIQFLADKGWIAQR